jgi:hypothetical protein
MPRHLCEVLRPLVPGISLPQVRQEAVATRNLPMIRGHSLPLLLPRMTHGHNPLRLQLIRGHNLLLLPLTIPGRSLRVLLRPRVVATGVPSLHGVGVVQEPTMLGQTMNVRLEDSRPHSVPRLRRFQLGASR